MVRADYVGPSCPTTSNPTMVIMLRRLATIVAAAHIGPTVLVTTVTALLAAVSGVDPARVLILTAMMATSQLSVGWSNDAIDASRDREAQRTDKPIARGDVSARTILALAIGSAVASLALSVALSPSLAAAHLVFLAAGWAYNLGLKRTLLASGCYVVAFALIPLLATLAREEPRPAAWWAMAMGGLLGLAAHFANVLPDLEADRRHGIASLPHRLGARAAGATALIALAVAGLLGVVGPGAATPITAIGASATVALLVAGMVVLTRKAESRALFRIIMAAALAAVVTLSGAASAIVS